MWDIDQFSLNIVEDKSLNLKVLSKKAKTPRIKYNPALQSSWENTNHNIRLTRNKLQQIIKFAFATIEINDIYIQSD